MLNMFQNPSSDCHVFSFQQYSKCGDSNRLNTVAWRFLTYEKTLTRRFTLSFSDTVLGGTQIRFDFLS